ncbi:MAG: hypothetical protein HY288_01695 [Planctomycetia bacterium]|nr:hypothetical protein [Planctomycetia bacterium]
MTVATQAAGKAMSEIVEILPRDQYNQVLQADASRKLGDQFNRTRLTPFVKSMFHTWLKWTR